MFAAGDGLYLYLESGLHVGTGEEGDEVDLPIQRDAATGYPVIPASSLKGAWRWQVRTRVEPGRWAALFGSPPLVVPREEGCLAFADARVLLYPVRSLKDVFAWITSAESWTTHRRELAAYGLDVSGLPDVAPPGAEAAVVAADSPLVTVKKTIVLEELSFAAQPRKEATALGNWLADHAFPQDTAYEHWRRKVRQAVVVLPDDAFRHFVVHRTEIVPRVRIDPATGTVAEGALWTEEFVPAEALFYAAVGALPRKTEDTRSPPPETALGWLKETGMEYVHLGGDRTLGKGIVRLRWLRPNAA